MSVAFQTPVRALAASALLMLAAVPSAVPAFAAAPAGQPTALVEDVSDGVAGVQPMDYLGAGRTVTLAAGQTLTLSYLDSCVNETITGGGVTIGARESTVTGGKIDRHTLPCDGGKLLLAANEAGKAGVTVFRSAPIALPGAKPKPDLTLYKTRPLLLLTAPGPVTFERLDAEGTAPVTVNVPGTTLDTAKGGAPLVPGGLYKVAAGAKSYVVKIDPQAKDEAGPALGRLIRF
ncbi:hypothetical protein [Azospirillum doebereinerae]|uniref:Uncharacterized protein n=1 Tax=Azospirillum doebereinerae TaxID=92933 RepID=A0A433J3P3_9PROT|nr:hypothetical protein [Azospirillum doebereinerae]MCG5240891.1 hypothetical protein [Azospirillum doebereinerae]RUQ66530.1 hypothetical protein EJ913_22115 [Azospirillum doebereinerae]